MSGIKYVITVDAFDRENAAKALRFIADRLSERDITRAHGDGGGLFGEPWRWSLQKDGSGYTVERENGGYRVRDSDGKTTNGCT